MSKLKKVILSGVLLALLIVLNRFVSIKTPLLVISFSFVPIMMAGVWLGPKYATLIAALGDFIGAILFPFGTYFPGFTISAGLKGFISNLIVLGIIEIFVVSLWLNIMYGKAYLAVVSTRILTQVIMFPIQVITIFILEKLTRPIVNRYLYEGESDNEG